MYKHFYVPRVVPLICPDGEERKEEEGGERERVNFMRQSTQTHM